MTTDLGPSTTRPARREVADPRTADGHTLVGGLPTSWDGDATQRRPRDRAAA